MEDGGTAAAQLWSLEDDRDGRPCKWEQMLIVKPRDTDQSWYIVPLSRSLAPSQPTRPDALYVLIAHITINVQPRRSLRGRFLRSRSHLSAVP